MGRTIIFFPVALVGGAISYGEFEKDARNLMGSFWAHVDQLTDARGQMVQPPRYQPPPPPEAIDPAATAEVKGDPGKPLEDVIREQDELRKPHGIGNVDSDGFDDGGGDDGDD